MRSLPRSTLSGLAVAFVFTVGAAVFGLLGHTAGMIGGGVLVATFAAVLLAYAVPWGRK